MSSDRSRVAGFAAVAVTLTSAVVCVRRLSVALSDKGSCSSLERNSLRRGVGRQSSEKCGRSAFANTQEGSGFLSRLWNWRRAAAVPISLTSEKCADKNAPRNRRRPLRQSGESGVDGATGRGAPPAAQDDSDADDDGFGANTGAPSDDIVAVLQQLQDGPFSFGGANVKVLSSKKRRERRQRPRRARKDPTGVHAPSAAEKDSKPGIKSAHPNERPGVGEKARSAGRSCPASHSADVAEPPAGCEAAAGDDCSSHTITLSDSTTSTPTSHSASSSSSSSSLAAAGALHSYSFSSLTSAMGGSHTRRSASPAGSLPTVGVHSPSPAYGAAVTASGDPHSPTNTDAGGGGGGSARASQSQHPGLLAPLPRVNPSPSRDGALRSVAPPNIGNGMYESADSNAATSLEDEERLETFARWAGSSTASSAVAARFILRPQQQQQQTLQASVANAPAHPAEYRAASMPAGGGSNGNAAWSPTPALSAADGAGLPNGARRRRLWSRLRRAFRPLRRLGRNCFRTGTLWLSAGYAVSVGAALSTVRAAGAWVWGLLSSGFGRAMRVSDGSSEADGERQEDAENALQNGSDLFSAFKSAILEKLQADTDLHKQIDGLLEPLQPTPGRVPSVVIVRAPRLHDTSADVHSLWKALKQDPTVCEDDLVDLVVMSNVDPDSPEAAIASSGVSGKMGPGGGISWNLFASPLLHNNRSHFSPSTSTMNFMSPVFLPSGLSGGTFGRSRSGRTGSGGASGGNVPNSDGSLERHAPARDFSSTTSEERADCVSSLTSSSGSWEIANEVAFQIVPAHTFYAYIARCCALQEKDNELLARIPKLLHHIDKCAREQAALAGHSTCAETSLVGASSECIAGVRVRGVGPASPHSAPQEAVMVAGASAALGLSSASGKTAPGRAAHSSPLIHRATSAASFSFQEAMPAGSPVRTGRAGSDRFPSHLSGRTLDASGAVVARQSPFQRPPAAAAAAAAEAAPQATPGPPSPSLRDRIRQMSDTFARSLPSPTSLRLPSLGRASSFSGVLGRSNATGERGVEAEVVPLCMTPSAADGAAQGGAAIMGGGSGGTLGIPLGGPTSAAANAFSGRQGSTTAPPAGWKAGKGARQVILTVRAKEFLSIKALERLLPALHIHRMEQATQPTAFEKEHSPPSGLQMAELDVNDHADGSFGAGLRDTEPPQTPVSAHSRDATVAPEARSLITSRTCGPPHASVVTTTTTNTATVTEASSPTLTPPLPARVRHGEESRGLISHGSHKRPSVACTLSPEQLNVSDVTTPGGVHATPVLSTVQNSRHHHRRSGGGLSGISSLTATRFGEQARGGLPLSAAVLQRQRFHVSLLQLSERSQAVLEDMEALLRRVREHWHKALHDLHEELDKLCARMEKHHRGSSSSSGAELSDATAQNPDAEVLARMEMFLRDTILPFFSAGMTRREDMREGLMEELEGTSFTICAIPLPDQRVYRHVPPAVPRCIAAHARGYPLKHTFAEEILHQQRVLQGILIALEDHQRRKQARRERRRRLRQHAKQARRAKQGSGLLPQHFEKAWKSICRLARTDSSTHHYDDVGVANGEEEEEGDPQTVRERRDTHETRSDRSLKQPPGWEGGATPTLSAPHSGADKSASDSEGDREAGHTRASPAQPTPHSVHARGLFGGSGVSLTQMPPLFSPLVAPTGKTAPFPRDRANTSLPANSTDAAAMAPVGRAPVPPRHASAGRSSDSTSAVASIDTSGVDAAGDTQQAELARGSHERFEIPRPQTLVSGYPAGDRNSSGGGLGKGLRSVRNSSRLLCNLAEGPAEGPPSLEASGRAHASPRSADASASKAAAAAAGSTAVMSSAALPSFSGGGHGRGSSAQSSPHSLQLPQSAGRDGLGSTLPYASPSTPAASSLRAPQQSPAGAYCRADAETATPPLQALRLSAAGGSGDAKSVGGTPSAAPLSSSLAEDARRRGLWVETITSTNHARSGDAGAVSSSLQGSPVSTSAPSGAMDIRAAADGPHPRTPLTATPGSGFPAATGFPTHSFDKPVGTSVSSVSGTSGAPSAENSGLLREVCLAPAERFGGGRDGGAATAVPRYSPPPHGDSSATPSAASRPNGAEQMAGREKRPQHVHSSSVSSCPSSSRTSHHENGSAVLKDNAATVDGVAGSSVGGTSVTSLAMPVPNNSMYGTYDAYYGHTVAAPQAVLLRQQALMEVNEAKRRAREKQERRRRGQAPVSTRARPTPDTLAPPPHQQPPHTEWRHSSATTGSPEPPLTHYQRLCHTASLDSLVAAGNVGGSIGAKSPLVMFPQGSADSSASSLVAALGAQLAPSIHQHQHQHHHQQQQRETQQEELRDETAQHNPLLRYSNNLFDLLGAGGGPMYSGITYYYTFGDAAAGLFNSSMQTRPESSEVWEKALPDGSKDGAKANAAAAAASQLQKTGIRGAASASAAAAKAATRRPAGHGSGRPGGEAVEDYLPVAKPLPPANGDDSTTRAVNAASPQLAEKEKENLPVDPGCSYFYVNESEEDEETREQRRQDEAREARNTHFHSLFRHLHNSYFDTVLRLPPPPPPSLTKRTTCATSGSVRRGLGASTPPPLFPAEPTAAAPASPPGATAAPAFRLCAPLSPPSAHTQTPSPSGNSTSSPLCTDTTQRQGLVRRLLSRVARLLGLSAAAPSSAGGGGVPFMGPGVGCCGVRSPDSSVLFPDATTARPPDTVTFATRTRACAALNSQNGNFGVTPLEVWLACRYSRKVAAEVYVMDIHAQKGDPFYPAVRVIDEVVAHAVLYYHNHSLRDFLDELETQFGLFYEPRTLWGRIRLGYAVDSLSSSTSSATAASRFTSAPRARRTPSVDTGRHDGAARAATAAATAASTMRGVSDPAAHNKGDGEDGVGCSSSSLSTRPTNGLPRKGIVSPHPHPAVGTAAPSEVDPRQGRVPARPTSSPPCTSPPFDMIFRESPAVGDVSMQGQPNAAGHSTTDGTLHKASRCGSLGDRPLTDPLPVKNSDHRRGDSLGGVVAASHALHHGDGEAQGDHRALQDVQPADGSGKLTDESHPQERHGTPSSTSLQRKRDNFYKIGDSSLDTAMYYLHVVDEQEDSILFLSVENCLTNDATKRLPSTLTHDEEVEERMLMHELKYLKEFLLEHRNVLSSASLTPAGSNRLEGVFGTPSTVFPFLACARESVGYVQTIYDSLQKHYGVLSFDGFAKYACDVFARDHPEIIRHAPRIFRTLNKSRRGHITLEELCAWMARKLSCGSNVKPDAHLLATTMSLRLPLTLLLNSKEEWVSTRECALPSLSDGDGDY